MILEYQRGVVIISNHDLINNICTHRIPSSFRDSLANSHLIKDKGAISGHNRRRKAESDRRRSHSLVDSCECNGQLGYDRYRQIRFAPPLLACGTDPHSSPFRTMKSFLLIALLPLVTKAFTGLNLFSFSSRTKLFTCVQDHRASELSMSSVPFTRSDFLRISTAAVIAPTLLSSPSPVFAKGESATPSVLVLGASGRTGMSVVSECLSRGIPVTAATRSGTDPFKVIKLDKTNYKPYATGVDVKDAAAVKAAVDAVNPTIVVFAASASKKGGNAKEVDFLGPKNVASAVGPRKLILISALAVSRPDSQGYKMTNSMGGVVDGIMSYKLQGEDAVRRSIKNYAIVRPGVLVSGKGGGEIEVAQGDFQGGGLSREVRFVSLLLASTQCQKY